MVNGNCFLTAEVDSGISKGGVIQSLLEETHYKAELNMYQQLMLFHAIKINVLSISYIFSTTIIVFW